MSNEGKLKILLLGPISSGKTTIANFLSDSTENISGENRPTKGVRIVEFVIQGVRGKGIYKNTVDVELWDCSGDNRYQSCWPAMQHKADGILFVYSDSPSNQKTDLEMLYSYFVKRSSFAESCCLVVKNQFGGEIDSKISANPLPQISHIVVNLEDRAMDFKKSFNSFISAIIKANLND